MQTTLSKLKPSIRLIKRWVELLQTNSPVVFILNREQFYVDEEPLDPRLSVSRIVAHFKKTGIESVSFYKGVEKKDLRLFLEIATSLNKYPDAEAMGKAMFKKRINRIKINHVFYKKVSAEDEVISREVLDKVTPEMTGEHQDKMKQMFMDSVFNSVLHGGVYQKPQPSKSSEEPRRSFKGDDCRGSKISQTKRKQRTAIRKRRTAIRKRRTAIKTKENTKTKDSKTKTKDAKRKQRTAKRKQRTAIRKQRTAKRKAIRKRDSENEGQQYENDRTAIRKLKDSNTKTRTAMDSNTKTKDRKTENKRPDRDRKTKTKDRKTKTKDRNTKAKDRARGSSCFISWKC